MNAGCCLLDDRIEADCPLPILLPTCNSSLAATPFVDYMHSLQISRQPQRLQESEESHEDGVHSLIDFFRPLPQRSQLKKPPVEKEKLEALLFGKPSSPPEPVLTSLSEPSVSFAFQQGLALLQHLSKAEHSLFAVRFAMFLQKSGRQSPPLSQSEDRTAETKRTEGEEGLALMETYDRFRGVPDLTEAVNALTSLSDHDLKQLERHFLIQFESCPFSSTFPTRASSPLSPSMPPPMSQCTNDSSQTAATWIGKDKPDFIVIDVEQETGGFYDTGVSQQPQPESYSDDFHSFNSSPSRTPSPHKKFEQDQQQEDEAEKIPLLAYQRLCDSPSSCLDQLSGSELSDMEVILSDLEDDTGSPLGLRLERSTPIQIPPRTSPPPSIRVQKLKPKQEKKEEDIDLNSNEAYLRQRQSTMEVARHFFNFESLFKMNQVVQEENQDELEAESSTRKPQKKKKKKKKKATAGVQPQAESVRVVELSQQLDQLVLEQQEGLTKAQIKRRKKAIQKRLKESGVDSLLLQADLMECGGMLAGLVDEAKGRMCSLGENDNKEMQSCGELEKGSLIGENCRNGQLDDKEDTTSKVLEKKKDELMEMESSDIIDPLHQSFSISVQQELDAVDEERVKAEQERECHEGQKTESVEQRHQQKQHKEDTKIVLQKTTSSPLDRRAQPVKKVTSIVSPTQCSDLSSSTAKVAQSPQVRAIQASTLVEPLPLFPLYFDNPLPPPATSTPKPTLPAQKRYGSACERFLGLLDLTEYAVHQPIFVSDAVRADVLAFLSSCRFFLQYNDLIGVD